MIDDLLLEQEDIAIELFKRKKQFFNEDFVTTTELNQFTTFIQRIFNERKLGFAIARRLDRVYFNVRNGIITLTDRGQRIDSILPSEVSKVLKDDSLIIEFFIMFFEGRIERIQLIQTEMSENEDSSFTRKMQRKDKTD